VIVGLSRLAGEAPSMTRPSGRKGDVGEWRGCHRYCRQPAARIVSALWLGFAGEQGLLQNRFEIGQKFVRIFAHRKMPHPLHDLPRHTLDCFA